MTKQNTTAEHWRLQLIAAVCALQQCTQTAANVIPLPGTDRFIAMGTKVEVARLLEIASAPAGESLEYRTCCDHPDCTTCKGYGGFYRMTAPAVPADDARCSHCDGTGDVHTPSGEWRGACACPAGTATEHAQSEGGHHG